VVATAAGPLLRRIEREFVERGLSGRELLCVTFDPVQGLVEVMLRVNALSADYPAASIVLGEIARVCAEDRIGVERLRRIVFRETEVRLELVDDRGAAEIYLFPVRAAGFDA
jgi:hypothetical protein